LIIAVAREKAQGERRVALVPADVQKLVGRGLDVVVECGAGLESGCDDAAYAAAGAKLEKDGAALLKRADLVLKVQPPVALTKSRHEADLIRKGAALIGFLRPLDEPDIAARLAKRNVTAFAMELVPRITRAQAIDALSSQATVAGYRAVTLAATALPRFFPMLVTAAGTVSPARVLVIGAGVAGLQAIATAHRLGAVVEAYDTRPVVREQVESLGARFVELELDTSEAEDAGGYAREQTEEFYEKQRELIAQRVAASDVVITTALVPGAPAPRLIEESAVQAMRPGSVIVDLAAPNGGNCALTRVDEEVVAHGVRILGPSNLPSEVAVHASQMYSRNVETLLAHLIPEDALKLDLEDELTSGPLLTHGGEVVNDRVRSLLSKKRGGKGS
jgi:NAD(P) transhydrogenase subunit alpha